jgi:hypothetical protein
LRVSASECESSRERHFASLTNAFDTERTFCGQVPAEYIFSAKRLCTLGASSLQLLTGKSLKLNNAEKNERWLFAASTRFV